MEAPLLPTTTTTTTTTSSSSPPASAKNIAVRVAALLAVAAVSLFAHHEASKGFDIAVVNSAPRGSAAARRFDVFFVSNGRAAATLHRASRAVEHALYPDASFPRKPVTRVTVQMAARDLAGVDATVAAGAAPGEYVISLSPNLMSSADAAGAVAGAVRRAVARVWLWDGRGAAPARMMEAMVAHLAAGGEDVEASPEDGRCSSARFLRHLEGRRPGFVARLNRAMREQWSDGAVDAALGEAAQPLCAAFWEALTGEASRMVDSTSDGEGSRLAV